MKIIILTCATVLGLSAQQPTCPGTTTSPRILVYTTTAGGQIVPLCVNLGTGLTVDPTTATMSAAGGGGGVSYAAQILDGKVVQNSGLLATVTACPSLCAFAVGSSDYFWVGGQTIVPDGLNTSNGTVWVYVDPATGVHVGSSAPGVTCPTACTVDSGITGFPLGMLHLATLQIVAGNFASTTDWRTFARASASSNKPYVTPYYFASRDAASGNVSGSGIVTTSTTTLNVGDIGPAYSLSSAGQSVIIHKWLPGSWDGATSVQLVLEWGQASVSLPAAGQNEVWQAQAACTVNGSSFSPTFGTPNLSAPVQVGPISTTTYTTLTVNTAGCSINSKLLIKISNSATGGSTTFPQSVVVISAFLYTVE